MLEARGLSAAIFAKRLYDELSFDADSKKVLALLGANGCGKTTLLHQIAGFARAKEGGSVFVDGMDVYKSSERAKSQKIGFLPQKSRSAELSVFDLVLLGRKPIFGAYPSHGDLQKTEQLLSSLGLLELSFRSCDTLSGGELQKALIAKALNQEPKLLLMDEPTNHLDAKNRVETLSLIKEQAVEKNISVVLVLHDINEAFRFADDALLFGGGKVVYYGNIEGVRESHLREIYNIEASIYSGGSYRFAIFG